MNTFNALKRNETKINIKDNFPGIDKNAKASMTSYVWEDENGNSYEHPFVPPKSEHFFQPEIFTDVKMWDEGLNSTPGLKRGFMLTGPTGSGKSSIIKQYASRINMPVMHINASEGTEEHSLLGTFVIAKGGEMKWKDGPLTTALRYGYWFLIDEIDLLEPSVQASLNLILDGAPLQLTTDIGSEVINQHPNFRFFATANTKGKGNVTGSYNGTQPGNEAAWDRFQGTEEVWYLDPKSESRVLDLVFDSFPLNPHMTKAMIIIANKVRDQFIGNDRSGSNIAKTLSSPISTRTLINWVALTYQYKALEKIADKPSPAMYALDRALGFRMETAEKLAIEEIAKNEFSKISKDCKLV